MKSIQYVQKRDGRIMPFDFSKIKEAVTKAAHTTNEMVENDIDAITAFVTQKLEHNTHPFLVERFKIS